MDTRREERIQATGARAAMSEDAKKHRQEQMRDRYISEVLFKGDFNDYFANRDKLMKDQGLDVSKMGKEDSELGALVAKRDQALAQGRYTTAMDTNNKIDEKIQEIRPEANFDYQTRRQLDKDAAKGLPMMSDALERIEAEELAGDAASRKSFVEGGFNLGYITEEREILEKKTNEALDELISSKMELISSTMSEADKDVALEDFVTVKLKTDIFTGDGEWDSFTEKQKQKHIEQYKNEYAGAESDFLRDMAVKSITNQERAIYLRNKGIYNDLNKIGGEYLKYGSERRKKKTATVTEQMAARVGDYARGEEDKLPELERAYNRRKAQEDATEFNTYTLEEKIALISEDARIIKELSAIPKEKLTDDQKNALSNRTQTQFRVVSSMLSSHPTNFPGLMGSINQSYKGKDLGSPEEAQNMLLGAVSGEDYDQVKNNFSNIQETVRQRLKEKDARLFRALKLGLDEGVRNNFAAGYGQVSEGVDEYGNKKSGFTNSFKSGTGQGNVLGTGVTDTTGSQWRQKQAASNVLPALTLLGGKDARGLFVLNGEGKVTATLGPESERAILAAATYSRTTLQNLGQNNIYSMFGGSWGESPWDGTAFQVTEAMGKMNAKLMTEFARQYSSTRGKNQADVLQSWRYIAQALKIDQVKGKSTAEATAEDLTEFFNEKLALKFGEPKIVINK